MMGRIAFAASVAVLSVGVCAAAGCDATYDPGPNNGAGPPGDPGTSDDAGAPSSSDDASTDTGTLGDDGGTGGGGSGDDGSPATGDDAGPASGTDGGVVNPPCSCAGGPANCAVWTNVFMTNYGFFDNSCTVETQHTCNTIAFPGLGPKKHPVAVEATGTYDDPITAAAASDNGGKSELESQGGATLAPGTIIYNALTQKYYIMEDQCAECTADYNCKWDDDDKKSATNPPPGCQKNTYFHIDFWMGPSFLTDSTLIQSCEDDSTIGSVYQATQGPLDDGASGGTVIINPPPNLPVRQGLLFTGVDTGNGGCWTNAQALPNQEVCN